MSTKTISAPRPLKTLPTDRLSISKQLDGLRAYSITSGSEKKSVSLDDVAKMIDLKPSTLGLANAFFKDIGLLVKNDDGFIVTDDVHDFARAHEFNPDTAPRKLAKKIAESWFGRCLVGRLRMRELTEGEAIDALADEAKASADYRKNLEFVMDLLDKTGVIARADGRIKLGPAVAGDPQEQTDNGHNGRQDPEVKAEREPRVIKQEVQKGANNSVSFSVSIDASMDEISTWTPERIAAFFAGLAQVISAKKGL